MKTVFYNPQAGVAPWVEWSAPREAILYKGHEAIDLLHNKTFQDGPTRLQHFLDQHQVVVDPKSPTVIHLFYEWGHFYHGNLNELNQTPLALVIKYSKQRRVCLPLPKLEKRDVDLISSPDRDLYALNFKKVYQHLLLGNSYQVNLTAPFHLRWRKNGSLESRALDLFHFPLRLGAYAHATIVPQLDWALVSNSPECLVERKLSPLRLRSMPIKGTVPLAESEDMREQFNFLLNDKKNRAELFMILDLLRNDLSSLGRPRADITHSQKPLRVGGLLHQYGIVEKKIFANSHMSWGTVIRALFPGGSITGAPKHRTMEIIKQVEQDKRSVCYGSTLLLAPGIGQASINIRTAEVMGRDIFYRAGGAITLLSEPEQEYQELLAKFNSFFS